MINGLKLFGLYLNMLGNVFSRPENKKIYIRRIIDEMINLGVNSLTIVSIISLFMGAVVTIQTGLQLNNPFIPKYLIGYATRESLILEFSPTMIALILAGKVGSSIASEIGTMRVSEQIDALEIMGINSAAFIIQPKIIASVLFFPFLVIISMGIGMFGGFLAATLGGIISKPEFLQGLIYWFEPFYIFYALVKTVFFAFAISSISSFSSLFPSSSSRARYDSSRSFVVTSLRL